VSAFNKAWVPESISEMNSLRDYINSDLSPLDEEEFEAGRVEKLETEEEFDVEGLVILAEPPLFGGCFSGVTRTLRRVLLRGAELLDRLDDS